jgi:hypothetical protein
VSRGCRGGPHRHLRPQRKHSLGIASCPRGFEASTSKLILLAQNDRLIEWIGQVGPAGSIQTEVLAAACGLSLIVYPTPDRLDMVALAAALSDQPLSKANRPRQFAVLGPKRTEMRAVAFQVLRQHLAIKRDETLSLAQ